MATAETNRRAKIFDRNNVYWCYAFGFSGAALGSVTSVLVIAVMVWAAISLLLRRFEFHHTTQTLRGSIICASYGAIIYLFTLAQNGPDRILPDIGLLVFFMPLLVVPRLLYSSPEQMFRGLVLGAAVGSIAIAVFTSIELADRFVRADGLSGNPNVFGVTTALFGSLGGLSMIYKQNWSRLLGAASLIAMIICVLASGMRIMWVGLPFLLLIVGWAAALELPRKLLVRIGVGILVAVLIVITAFGNMIGNRLGHLSRDLTQISQNGDYQSSTGARVLLWRSGIDAVLDEPFSGYGIGDRMKALVDKVPEEHRRIVQRFNHPHNGFLAAALDAGLLGAFSLCMLLFYMPISIFREDRGGMLWRGRMAAGLLMTCAFLGTGMFNIMFQHDILDAAFVGLFAILLASSYKPESEIGGTVTELK